MVSNMIFCNRGNIRLSSPPAGFSILRSVQGLRRFNVQGSKFNVVRGSVQTLKSFNG